MSASRDSQRSPDAPAPRQVVAGLDEAPTIDAHSDDGDAPDSFDDILRKVVRGGGDGELGIGSELAGRFQITRVLGEGGMGTVYVARDTSLGRDVAIKVHRAGGAGRLRREAVAMARLAHPNVVTVFEVGDLEGRPFVVMEYVPGTTLRAWLAAAPRSVREILAMVIAAGEGLAAAHDAGLVHRDVKPENVLVGSDGRARVGDFGLARELDATDDAPPAPSDSLDSLRTPVTQTGAVLGTPAYMSPEQFAGAPVDARADQFAFCVTAWEALWSERPFEGTSYAQLHAAIALGTRRPPPATPKVPARVRLALERGLAIEPDERFPTMHALLAAIRPAARRRTLGLAAGAAAIALAGATTFGVLRGTDSSCDAAGAAELAHVPRDLPARLVLRGAAKIGVQAAGVQAAYVAGFRDHARAACRADRAHQWSPEIVAKSQACFAITARIAARTLASLDPGKPMDVLRHLRKLPTDDHCRNQTHLAARPEPPRDPQQLRQLIDANATLAVGFDAVESHDFAQLRHVLRELEASPARTDPVIAAGVLVLRGWVAFADGKVAETRKLFVDAYYAGRAIDDEQISSVALALVIEHGVDMGLEASVIQEWLRTALADAERVHARAPWLAGRVYTVAARHADLAGDAPTALERVARARAVLEPGDPTRIETYLIEGAVLMWSGRVDDGVKAYETAIAQKAAYAGPEDPEVASMLSDFAASLLEVGRLDQALATADRAALIISNLADPTDDRIDPIRVNLAAVLIAAGRDAEAQGLLELARANNVRRFGETSTVIANIDTNLAAIYNGRGEYDRAIAALRSALAIEQKAVGPDHVDVADVLYNLASAYRYKRDYPAAITAARQAAQIHGARSPGSDRHRTALTMVALAANEAGDHAQALEVTATALGFAGPSENAQTAAWSQLERARALIGLGRGAEARPLLETARVAYAKLEMPQRVQQVDELLARLARARPGR